MIEANEVRYEDYHMDDAEFVFVGYGVVARILHTVVDDLRTAGHKVGLVRLITLWPFPKKHLKDISEKIDHFMVVELSNGQMVDDVRLAIECRTPVHFYNRMGGMVPSTEEIIAKALTILKG